VTPEEEREEHELRVEQMTVNIEKMRADMRTETWKIGISLVIGFAAAIGAGVGIATYFGKPSPLPQTIIIQQQPVK
jgi:hypothetical protein